jgi:hypothetical protein
MNTLLLIAVLGQSFNWSDSAADPRPDVPVVKPTPAPDPPKPEPTPVPDPPPAPNPKIWKAIYRKDSRGYQCQGYTERELDAFIRGRESAFAQQVESQQPQQQFTPILQYQYGMSSCANGSCQTVAMPY